MDQTRDVSGQQLYRLIKLYPPPEFVKKASVTDLCGEDLPPEAYGDPRRRLFPCHTAAATWTSLAFLLDKRAELKAVDADMIEERIMHCAGIHGISNSVAQLKEAVAKGAAVFVEPARDEDYALVWEEGGVTHRRYPLRNPAEVKAAADYLHRHRDHPAFPFEIRQQFADKILQKQAQLGVTLGPLNEFIEKQAGHGACSAKEAAELIRSRVHASRRGPGPLSELQTEMLKFADMIATHPARFREPGMRVKVASVVDAFDRETRLPREYGDNFLRVEDALFGLTREKMAAVIREHVGTTTGNMYRLADLERIKLAELRDYFGDEFCDRLTSDGLHVDSEKAAAFIQTLPRDDAEQLDRFLDGFGIKPMAKEASDTAVKVSAEYLMALKAARQKAMAS